MNVGEIVFLFIILATMCGAAMAILSASIVYALVGLVTAMFGVAGLYIYLNSPFLAMMQILIYVGAVTILIAFAIMLAGPLYRRPKEWTTFGKFTAALVVALTTLIIFSEFVGETFPKGPVPVFIMGPRDIGLVFFGGLLLPFELISLLLVVGILGAIMLALLSRRKDIK